MGVPKFAYDANGSAHTVPVNVESWWIPRMYSSRAHHRSIHPRSPLPVLITPSSSYPLRLSESTTRLRDLVLPPEHSMVDQSRLGSNCTSFHWATPARRIPGAPPTRFPELTTSTMWHRYPQQSSEPENKVIDYNQYCLNSKINVRRKSLGIEIKEGVRV